MRERFRRTFIVVLLQHAVSLVHIIKLLREVPIIRRGKKQKI